MKYSAIIATILFCIFQSSCKKDFLDKNDPIRIGTETFFKNEDQMNQAINGVYSRLQSIVGGEYLFKEMMSDNTGLQMYPSDRGGAAGWEAFEFSTVNSGNGEIPALWSRYYGAIFNVNNSLEKLPGADMPDSSRTQAEGELKFLRAYLYFDLVQYFGDVVLATTTLKTPNEAFDLVRSKQADVYTQIENDLKDAVSKMPVKQPAAKRGRATKGSALSLLGKVYLTTKRYAEAVSTLQQVLTLGYSLMPTYADVFDPTKKNNAESIFEIQFQGDNDQGEWSSFTYTFAPLFSGAVVTGYDVGRLGGRNIPTRDMIKAYEAGDLRFNVSLDTQYTRDAVVYKIPYVKKFNHAHTIKGRTNDNWPVLRYADVLLMLAEAINETGIPTTDAFSYLNQVRARAGLAPLNGLSQAAFRAAVLKERRVELAFENHRLFDLRRTKTPAEFAAFMNVHGAQEKANPTTDRGGVPFNAQDYVYTENEYVLPIPASEILINTKLTQNLGY